MDIIISNTLFTGKVLEHLPKIDSTNNYAKQLLTKSNPIDGTVILADEQIAGRGQESNIWQSESNKNLTLSIIYKTSFLKATEQFWLNMAISLGVWSMVNSQWSIESENKTTTKIKWPNDIYIKNSKIAGILIENTIIGMNLKNSIIGIGLNINQTEFNDGINATSLKLILQQEINKNEALNLLMSSIESYFLLLKERKFMRLKNDYLEHLFRLLIPSNYKKNGVVFTGKIIDINDFGNLIMETENGIEQFGFKDIAFVF